MSHHRVTENAGGGRGGRAVFMFGLPRSNTCDPAMHYKKPENRAQCNRIMAPVLLFVASGLNRSKPKGNVDPKAGEGHALKEAGGQSWLLSWDTVESQHYF